MSWDAKVSQRGSQLGARAQVSSIDVHSAFSQAALKQRYSVGASLALQVKLRTRAKGL